MLLSEAIQRLPAGGTSLAFRALVTFIAPAGGISSFFIRSGIMARGDALYANGNVDWHQDPRCRNQKNNDSRWLNEIIWRISVKERRETLPDHYTTKYLADQAQISEKKTKEYLVDMAAAGLISLSPQGVITVHGSRKCHAKLKWRETIIAEEASPHAPRMGNLRGASGAYTPRSESESERKSREKEKEKRPTRALATEPEKPTNGKAKKQAPKRPETKSFYELSFSQFWAAWPEVRRQGEKQALAQWVKLKPDAALAGLIIAKVNALKETRDWKDLNYIKHAWRWLRDERWKDPVVTAQQEAEAAQPPLKERIAKWLQGRPNESYHVAIQSVGTDEEIWAYERDYYDDHNVCPDLTGRWHKEKPPAKWVKDRRQTKEIKP